MGRFDLTVFEWSVIEPLLPRNSPAVPRVDDRRVLNGIFRRLRTGALQEVSGADIPWRYEPRTTCVNRFNRWRRAGIWDASGDAALSGFSRGRLEGAIVGPTHDGVGLRRWSEPFYQFTDLEIA